MFVFGVLLECLTLTTVFAAPRLFDDTDEYETPDYDPFEHLQQMGSKVYGRPKESTGESVSKWTPDSAVHPEELGEYAEGDILHPEPEGRQGRNGLRAKSSRWPNKTIPYEISPYIRGNDRRMIEDSIEEFHKYTCLKFKERRSSDTDYVYFTNGNTGCWSSVGRIGGRQEINLQTPGCTTKKGTVMHEMLHATGFMHEQNRPDRDKYVTINYNNIERGKESNFEKAQTETVDNQGIGYDYRSVMHYSSDAFSRNGQPTIEPKVRGTTLGQREGFSKRDVQKVLKMYGCTKSSSGGGNNNFLSALGSLFSR